MIHTRVLTSNIMNQLLVLSNSTFERVGNIIFHTIKSNSVAAFPGFTPRFGVGLRSAVYGDTTIDNIPGINFQGESSV